MVSGIGRFFRSVKSAMQSADDVARLADDAANTVKQATKVQLKPANKAAEKMGLHNYGTRQQDYVWGSYKFSWRTSLDGKTSRETKTILDYRNQILGLPEGQVVTKSGKVYTRTMGPNGQRIYTDANGNVTTFNNHRYDLPWERKSSCLCRLNSNGGQYSLQIHNDYNGNQVVSRYVQERPGGASQMNRFVINNQGEVLGSDVHRHGGQGFNSLSGSEVRYGCRINWDYMSHGWLHRQGTTQAPPKWTSLSNYT